MWSWHFGPAKDEVDHRDNDPRNNAIENLRAATPSENKVNRRARVNVSSPFIGVSFDKSRRRWKAGIRSAGRSKTLGWFKCPTMAAITYDKAAMGEFGEFARLNFGKQRMMRHG